MVIILEGPDNAGKTTLAEEFKKLGAKVHPSGGPPPDQKTLLERMQGQKALLHDTREIHVLDRLSSISQAIYSPLGDELYLAHHRMSMISNNNTLLIYCRPSDEACLNFSTHVAKDYDTPEHLEFVQKNAKSILYKYDELMSQFSHVRYNYEGESPKAFATTYFTAMRSLEYRRYLRAWLKAARAIRSAWGEMK